MSDRIDQDREPGWYCLRCQPRHEHIAAAHLVKEAGLEVYLPRIRFRRSTRRGPVWFTEALFPGYLFARFDLNANGRRVMHARGVLEIVHFGRGWPSVPDQTISDLRAVVGSDEAHVVSNQLAPGEEVRISGGALHDLRAVVVRVLPARERVAVLLEFLGQQTMVEVPAEHLVSEGAERRRFSK